MTKIKKYSFRVEKVIHEYIQDYIQHNKITITDFMIEIILEFIAKEKRRIKL